MISSRIMIIVVALTVLASLAMVYVYTERFTARDAAPTAATSTPTKNASPQFQDY